MTIRDEYMLSTFVPLSVKSKKETATVSLVMDNVDEKLYIRKDYTGKAGLDTHRILKTHRHKNLPDIYAVVETQNGYTVIEEYIHGETLAKQIGRLPENLATDYFIQLCDALIFLHNRETPIIHRDIKPENIILSNDGVIKLIDFDASKEYKHWKTEDTTLMGTKAYAAPEQHGYAMTDTKTDIFSLGLTLYHLLTGEHYHNKNALHMYKGKLLPVLKKCVQIDPANRYADVKTLKNDLVSPRLYIFPDLIHAPKHKKTALLVLYGILGIFMVSALYIIISGLIQRGYTQFNFFLTLFVMYVAPHAIISNFLGIRNRLPVFNKKGRARKAMIGVTAFCTLYGMYLMIEILFEYLGIIQIIPPG
jgi:hypothetical protein